MSGEADTAEADAALKEKCNSATPPGGTTQPCPLAERKVLTLKWDKDETWCSEGGAPISGTTKNYADAELIPIQVKGQVDGSAVKTLQGRVSSNAFRSPWDVIDVLPVGGPSWQPRRKLDGEASGVKTPEPLTIRFIPNVKRGKKTHSAQYDRTDPGATAAKKVSVECRFELESSNYLLTIYGELKYVRGHGRERLQLGDPSLTGGFATFGVTSHWGYVDATTGKFKYWDGTAWKDTPATWIPDNSNHFGIAFYKSGSKWKCRDTTESWPHALTDWPANQYTGAGNATDTTLATWKTNIETVWTDKFDIKRKQCRSTIPECCRYKTRCVARFTEVDSYNDDTIILVYENVRSDSGMWSLGDTRYGLAPHEFGHLLGAPDEYGGVGTTQLGVTDSDGLVNGIDANCIMGAGLSNPKRRHYKGICEVFALLVKDEWGKSYTYEAIGKAGNLASPPGTPAIADTGSSSNVGVIIGAIIGAVAGAVIGFIASGGNPAGAVAGAVAGAIVGAAIGSMF
ncbi:MAG: glycine zipper domain-containing protein [Burkholderiales bacterium]